MTIGKPSLSADDAKASSMGLRSPAAVRHTGTGPSVPWSCPPSGSGLGSAEIRQQVLERPAFNSLRRPAVVVRRGPRSRGAGVDRRRAADDSGPWQGQWSVGWMIGIRVTPRMGVGWYIARISKTDSARRLDRGRNRAPAFDSTGRSDVAHRSADWQERIQRRPPQPRRHRNGPSSSGIPVSCRTIVATGFCREQGPRTPAATRRGP